MNKKILLAFIAPSLLLTSLTFKSSTHISLADDAIYFDNNAIEPLSHANGITINFINDSIKTYYDNAATDFSKLSTLYQYSDEIEEFADYLSDKDYMLYLYNKWDDFKPTNNTLTWKSNVRANSYDVVVSLNSELTEVIYEANNLKDTNYTLINPYANTHYFWQITAHLVDKDIKSPIFDFYSGNYKRTLDINGVSNTRDIGGFTSEFGIAKQGLIYRGARLDDISQDGIKTMNTLNIQSDIDLRNDGEGSKNPSERNNYYLTTLQNYYQAFSEEYRSSTIEVIKKFIDPNNYPIYFHCQVGRDRTGTLAILLQALAGASEEYILHDYYTSMWSLTGAYSKTLNNLNYETVYQTIECLKEFGSGDLKTGAENFLLKRKDQITGEEVGLTKEEIQTIRDIWFGKIEVSNAIKTYKAADNYEGMALVKIKSLGHQDINMMVNKGHTISVPYQLDASYQWFVNGSLYDFKTPIKEDVIIYADLVNQYLIVIHFIGANKNDDMLYLYEGTTLTLDKYEIKGYNMLAISDTGNEISKLEITRNAYINIIYSK